MSWAWNPLCHAGELDRQTRAPATEVDDERRQFAARPIPWKWKPSHQSYTLGRTIVCCA